MSFKKLLTLSLVAIMALAMNALAVEDGDNVFELEWSSQKVDFPAGVPLTCWDVVTLPDLNDDGRNELLIAADDNVQGAWYFVMQASANDVYEVIWYYYIEQCVYSYVLNHTTPEQDLDGDGLPEIMAGVAQDDAIAGPGLWIWEKDTTITEPIAGSTVVFPFSMDAPTATWDVNAAFGSITCIFSGNFDSDENTELVLGETRDDIVYVLEETTGDLSFPIFEIEYMDTLVYSPWGFYHGDLDNDGQGDFGIGSSDFNSIRLYENTGVEDDYVKHMEINLDNDVDGYTNRSMGARDINGDGLGEIIYVRYTAPGKVWVVSNPGEMSLIDSTNIHEIFMEPAESRLIGAAYGDMDHGFATDGPDLFFTARDAQKVYDLEYTGPVGEGVDPYAPGDPANWTVYDIYTKDQRMQGLAVSDYDRDGEGEVAIIYANGSDENYVEFIEHVQLPDAGATIVWHDDPSEDTCVDPLQGNPRGIYAGSDVDQDGKPEIICPEYNGKFHVYEVVADNTIEWVFSYEMPGAPANGSQPRYPIVGDIDGNGLQEIIVHMGGTDLSLHPDSLGFYFFEWDGVTDNGFGLSDGVDLFCDRTRRGPTYILPDIEIDARLTGSARTESPYIDDVDMDGNQELLFPCDHSATSGDGLFIVSCVDGELVGFPTFLTELAQLRSAGECTGSPKMATSADLNGNGMKEAIFATWNNGQLSIFEAIAPDTYEETIIFTDITNTDETVYTGMGAFDIDMDGDDELLFNSYWNSTIYLINAPENIADIDVNNPAHYAWLRDDPGGSGLTGDIGDQDQDGLPEFYFTLYTRGAVRMLEYNGGGADIMAQESYTVKEVFVDRDYVQGPYAGINSAHHGSFGIKVPEIDPNMAPQVDMDGDGNKELVVSEIEAPVSDVWLYVYEFSATGVKSDPWRVVTPNDYKLYANYPNPFNASTRIEFYTPLDKRVTLKIYNALGQEVVTLLNNQFTAAGHHAVNWDGTDNSGRLVSTGAYIYSLQIGNMVLTQQMTMLK